MQQSTQRRFFRKKYCKFCAEKIEFIDYKNSKFLRGFMTERGKILSRKLTGTCSKHQRQLTVAIKRARSVALLPYIEL
ncbi:MAG TPA: 30S ribosomal protein S18 [Thermodesulfovibrio thiophilus]|uniref:30S ribosomal protein S18 n=1 Tax=Thermodesulfovibrio thiophilus TaxID=340095 RepID=UPI00041CC3C5|nr:30S ribosomal protein S18 [Thermodesulfovibrio thiophilus]HHW19818.1 30S ribosomal protein S18 [Thermodesulfovibrio thiophilus]HOA82583.1 30S ribosomal protein S18 [Thermodesulfovibrio thiophilus]HQA03213.1 30S ribosomal protein S18 [Thermodesulfovibrio thiophilus]HQD35575.1 30S ribosomal protein S18 [Thermodesulfovibrio thiophilus]